MSRRIAENPFYVLELATECSAMDVEMQGQKLLAMLEVGMAAAKTYSTPMGSQDRDQERVRNAMTELRDPKRRIVHELWAQLPPETLPEPTEAPLDGPWPEAFKAMGWTR